MRRGIPGPELPSSDCPTWSAFGGGRPRSRRVRCGSWGSFLHRVSVVDGGGAEGGPCFGASDASGAGYFFSSASMSAAISAGVVFGA